MGTMYRVRWKLLYRPGIGDRRMCVAERRYPILWGLFHLWWPMDSSRWRNTEIEALADIDRDIHNSKDLPATKYYEREV